MEIEPVEQRVEDAADEPHVVMERQPQHVGLLPLPGRRAPRAPERLRTRDRVVGRGAMRDAHRARRAGRAAGELEERDRLRIDLAARRRRCRGRLGGPLVARAPSS